MVKLELEKQYNDSGLSMAAIAGLHNCSVHKIEYWMKVYGIARRTRSDATYLKRNPHGDPFLIKSVN
jgi:hypothetical protein